MSGKNQPEKKKGNTLFMIIIFIAALILLYIWKFGVGTAVDDGAVQTSETSAVSEEQ